MNEIKLTNHDARCLNWYRRLVADGTAEDGQRIAVMLEDECKRLVAENARLKAERKALLSAGKYPCTICVHVDEPENRMNDGMKIGICHLCQGHSLIEECFELKGWESDNEKQD